MNTYYGVIIPIETVAQLLPLRNLRGVFDGDEFLRRPYLADAIQGL